MFEPGTVLRHAHAYRDTSTGELNPKYLLVLARVKRSHDLVWRLLTSRPHGRPERPACYHGFPYPGFYLGVLAPEKGLGTKSWLDLRFFPDGDVEEIKRDITTGVLSVTCKISSPLLRDAALCVASADDTTARQETSIRDYFT